MDKRSSRKTDLNDEPVHYQMGRFAQQNGQWFYATREAAERGPFETLKYAESDLALYMQEHVGEGEISH